MINTLLQVAHDHVTQINIVAIGIKDLKKSINDEILFKLTEKKINEYLESLKIFNKNILWRT